MVLPVLSQCDPDPDFSGTKSPNPEVPAAYDEAIALMKKHGMPYRPVDVGITVNEETIAKYLVNST